MRLHHRFLLAVNVLPLLLAAGAGCAKSDTIGDTFQNLGGSGGDGVGGGGQGASGAGVTTTTTGETTTSGSTTSSTSSSTTTTTTTTTTTPTCMDTGAEPNETESTAVNLGTIDDCDNSGESFSGVLNGPNDVDWYRYSGKDVFPCVVDPARTVTFMMPARICKFVQCEAGGTPSFTCPNNTTGATSPDQRPGCCGSQGFKMDIDCPGMNDHAAVYIRVDNPNGGACIPYKVDYHY
jgi:hypothetical protein